MMPTRRVFVSASSNRNLDPRRAALKAAILQKVSGAGFEPQEFWESGMAENMAWSFENVNVVMKRCVGAIVIGFPRWQISGPMSSGGLVGEYNHYEGAVAMSYSLPTFLLAENGVENRGVVWTGGGKPITFIPETAQPSWVNEPDFQKGFNAWVRAVNTRKDIFLGYCSQNIGTAAIIENRLTREGATVLNYMMDFRSGTSILNEIALAASCCSAGIFLFAENDPLEGKPGEAAPRDNVVFEAGYFMNSKGPERCLIIREGNAKMPADLGGAIYLHLNGPGDIASIESRLTRFLKDNL
jgi:Predicted nucleotide-binding protein containing TIR-like domain